MNINDIFGQVKEEVAQKEELAVPTLSPFDFLNAINYNKTDLIVDVWTEKQYPPYLINRGLSFSSDTVIPANEVNSRSHLDKKLQFQFLINTIRPKKRYVKWLKPGKIDAIEIIKAYYGFSTEKARQALTILNKEQIDYLKQKLEKGG